MWARVFCAHHAICRNSTRMISKEGYFIFIQRKCACFYTVVETSHFCGVSKYQFCSLGHRSELARDGFVQYRSFIECSMKKIVFSTIS